MTKQFLRLTFIGLISLASITTKSFGQTTTKEITDKFFTLFSKDPDKAIDYAFSTNKVFDNKQDELVTLKDKLKNFISFAGNFYGEDLISEKTAGKNISKLTFIVRFEKQPLRFTFLFYKPKDTWQLNNFSYDENLDEILK